MKTSRSRLWYSSYSIYTFALPFVATFVLLTGCGGGDLDAEMNMPVAADHTQSSGTVSQPVYHGAVQPVESTAAMTDEAAASTFELNSMEDFKGFNPEIWNDQRSWYECNCGDTQPASPNTMPWNPAG